MYKRMLIVLVLVLVVVAAGMRVYQAQEKRELTGYVRDAETHAPLEDALVSVAGYMAATDAQGFYAIAIPRGTFTLTVEADGYIPAQTEVNGADLFTRAFTVASVRLPSFCRDGFCSSGERLRLDLALTANRVAGIVRDAETQQPLANVPVQIGDKSVTTNAQGAFEARGVKNGTTIVAQALAYQPAVSTFTGQSDLVLALVPNTLVVSVSDQFTRQPIANAKIQVGDQVVVSDAQGRATLRRIKPGVTVRVSAPRYESASGVTPPLLAGSDVQFALRPNTLDGIVADATTGQPINSALVYLGSAFVTTNAQGVYHFDNVPAAAALVVKAAGYRKTQMGVSGVTRRDIKLTPFLVKGIHIPFGATPEHVRDLIDLVNKTELNAIVVTVKSERGRIAWDTQVALAKQIGAPQLNGVDLSEVVERCRSHNIYCIARFVVFQDTLLASARPSLALRYPNGTTYSENGYAWTNPQNSDVVNYNLALAKQVAALGFDEIQFDYVRFPGRVSGLYHGTNSSEEARVSAVTSFLARAQKELRPGGVFVSADVFGLTTATDEDHYTGQRLRDLGPYLDFVSPMVYPDVWIESAFLLNHGLGIQNCSEAVRCPYEVIYNSYKRAAEKTSTKVRLWLQAYPGRGDFGLAQYRLQKKAATEAGSHGWMFWNGQGNYDAKLFGPPGQ